MKFKMKLDNKRLRQKFTQAMKSIYEVKFNKKQR